MRATRLLPVPLLVLALACSDGDGASPATPTGLRANRLAPGGQVTASVVIPPRGGFTSTVLARGTFRDDINAQFRIKQDERTKVVHVDDPSEMVMAKVTIAPGGALPWHTHPGPALVTIASGELTFVDSHECAVRVYAKGDAFMDEGQGHVHVAFNAGATEMVLYVTYLGVPKGQPALVPTENPGC